MTAPDREREAREGCQAEPIAAVQFCPPLEDPITAPVRGSLGDGERRCGFCGHRESDHRFGVYVDAEPCTWPGCGCDAFSEAIADDQEDEHDAARAGATEVPNHEKNVHKTYTAPPAKG